MSAQLGYPIALLAVTLVPACLDPAADELQSYSLQWTIPSDVAAVCSAVEVQLEFPDPPYQDPRYEKQTVPCTVFSTTYRWGAYDTPDEVCVFVRSGTGSAERTVGRACGDFGSSTSLVIAIEPSP